MDSGDDCKSLSPKCDICSDHAVVMIHAPRGCTCLAITRGNPIIAILG